MVSEHFGIVKLVFVKILFSYLLQEIKPLQNIECISCKLCGHHQGITVILILIILNINIDNVKTIFLITKHGVVLLIYHQDFTILSI